MQSLTHTPDAGAHSRWICWRRRLLRVGGGGVLFYVAMLAVGLIPVNNDFETFTDPDAVTIYVTSSAIHADLIVPTRTAVIDWTEYFPASNFAAQQHRFSHVAFGWGDRGFYLNTPEWKDLKLRTAANALLWPSETVMHVQWTRPRESEHTRAVTISPQAYERLADYIRNSFRLAQSDANARFAQRTTRIDVAYNRWDAFYQARGRYHLFNTCNCWVGGGLKASGVRVPWFAPLPKTVFWYLPK